MSTIAKSLEDRQAEARQAILKKFNAGTCINPLNQRKVDRGNAFDNDGNANAWNEHMNEMTREMAMSDYVIASQEPEVAAKK